MLKEHLRNRLQHDQPRALLACVVLVDSRVYSACGPPARVFIPVTFYVQTKKTTVIPLEAWICDGSVWTPVPGELCGNPEFDADMSKPAPWAVLQIFSKLALNKVGRRAKRVIARFDCRAMHAITIFIGCSEGDHSTRSILPFSQCCRRGCSKPPRQHHHQHLCPHLRTQPSR